MTSKKHKHEKAAEQPEVAGVAGDGAGDAPEAHPHVGLVEPADEQVRRLTEELSQAKDQYLRLAADMDNVRRRASKERTESWTKAQAEVVANVLDALDDLGRVAHLDPDKTSSQDVLVGVEMVERKLLKELEGAGLERVGAVGEAFNPAIHEAVSTVPAGSAADDHTVSAVFQPGYRFGGGLIRPARVQVRMWAGGE
jgi:molecular chaperone GrpE